MFPYYFNIKTFKKPNNYDILSKRYITNHLQTCTVSPGIFSSFLDHIFILGVIQLNGADCKLTWVPPGGAWFQTGWHCSAPVQCQRTAWRNAGHLYFSCGLKRRPTHLGYLFWSSQVFSLWQTEQYTTHGHRRQQQLLSDRLILA